MGTFVRKSRLTLAGQVGTLILGTISSVILARVLGPDGKGIFAVCTLIPFLIVTVFDFGVVPSSAYFLARRRHPPGEVLGNNILFAGALGTAGVVLGAVAISLLRATAFAAVPPACLYGCLLLAPLQIFFLFVQAVPLGLQRFADYNRAAVLRSAFFLIGTVMLVWAPPGGALYALAASAFAWGLAGLVLFAETRRLAGRPVLRLRRSYLREVSRFGLQSHVGNLLSYLNYRGDLLLVNWLLGPAAAGFYSVSVLIAEQLWIFTNAVQPALFLRVAAENDPGRRKEFTPRLTRAMLLIGLPPAAALALLAGWIVKLLFSDLYLPAVLPLRLLIPGALAMGISRLIANDIAGRGRPLLNSYLAGAMLVLNLGLDLLWIPRYGIGGAALASSLCYGAALLVRMVIYCRLSGNRWRDLLIPRRGDPALVREGLRAFLSRPAPGRKETDRAGPGAPAKLP